MAEIFIVEGVISWIAVAQAAVVVYGLYTSYRAASNARRAAKNAQNANPQLATGDSTDLPRTIAYGRIEVNGRDARVVGATDTRQTYWIVRALTPDHPLDALEEVLFDGVPIGPLVGDPLLGAYVGPGSPYHTTKLRTNTVNAIATLGEIVIAPGPVQQILSFFVAATDTAQAIEYRPMTVGDQPGGYFGDDGSNVSYGDPADVTFADNVMNMPDFAAGRAYILSYSYLQGIPHVWVKFYRGTEDQTVCEQLQLDEPTWSVDHRLRGIPYLAVWMYPDVDVFQSGAPRISAIVRGKRLLDPRDGQTRWSANCALEIYDQFLNEFGCLPEEINVNLIIAAANACDEAIAGQAPKYTAARYEGHINLSTETSPRDNVRLLLAAMAGQMTFAGATFDVRAGVWYPPDALLNATTLDSSDLADASYEQQPFQPTLDTFNAVRGRYTSYELYPKRFIVTDFPPYQSPFYARQDQGFVKWEDMDLQAVQNPMQAQRIAKLRLHLARNALTFRATWKLKAAALSAGSLVRVTMPNLNQPDKYFQIIQRGKPESNKISLLMQELPNAVFNYDYREGVDPDPAPNTNLPDPTQVAAIVGLTVESGPEVADYGPNGVVRGSIRVRWTMTRDLNVLYGGRIDLWFKKPSQTEWAKIVLPGDSVRYDIPVLRGDTFTILIRNSNGVASGGWQTLIHTAVNAPSPYLTGNLLPMTVPVFDLTVVPVGLKRPGWKLPYFLGPNVFGTWGASQPIDENSESYGFFAIKPSAVQDGNVSSVFAESDIIAIEENAEVLGFFRGFSYQGTKVSCFIRCYNSAKTYISDIAVSQYIPDVVPKTGQPFLGTSVGWGFGKTPAGTAGMTLCISLTPPSNPGVGWAFEFFKPYLGRAAAGQVTLPPWQS